MCFLTPHDTDIENNFYMNIPTICNKFEAQYLNHIIYLKFNGLSESGGTIFNFVYKCSYA